MTVKSVYNFVPAPKENEVFKPEWAKQVSHDIPFSDGESGEIEIKITAETPVFIRNGHSKDNESNEFSHYVIDGEKKYFIPATSLKGMLRNVLEIISNSKLSLLNDHRHSIRQIMKTQSVVMDEGYELANDAIKRQIKAGYLKMEGDKYYIYPCGVPLKIRFTDIDERYKKDFSSLFGKKDLANIKENFNNRTAKYKYELLEGCNLEAKFEMHPLDDNEKQKSWVSKFQPLKYVRFSDENNSDTFDGTIVLVGQASNYDVSTARKGEYVFRGRKSVVTSNFNRRIEVSIDKVEDFKFINRDGKGDSNELKDWAYWKNKIKDGIPVFYREKKSNQKKEIIDFGLSFTYKQPAQYRVKDLLPNYPLEQDLAEIIFGSIEKDSELKGRIFFGHAKCITDNPKKEDDVIVSLGSPKSSYTPFYLKQFGNSGKTIEYYTYNTGGELRGFKRYPIKDNIYNHLGESIAMQTTIIPLSPKTKFIEKIRYFNLRPIELGALLSAITLNNSENTFHNLGYAKPLGYGKIKISDININGVKENIEDYISKFQVEMIARYGKSWISKVNELLSMSLNAESSLNIDLEYNDLKDFQSIKDKGLYLQDYTSYGINYNYTPNLNDKVKERRDELEKEKNEIKANVKSLKKTIQSLKDEGKFEEAISRLKELNSLEAVGNIDNEINELKQLAKERVEKEKIEMLIARKDLEELKEFVSRNPYHERSQEINTLIKKLVPTSYPDRFMKVNFDQFMKEVVLWIRKNDINIEEFKIEIIRDLKRTITEDKLKRGKNWIGDFSSNNNWKKISSWLGEALAKNLFDKLTNPNN